MNTKGIKFLAVLAVLAMAFAAFAVVAPAVEQDAVNVETTQDIAKANVNKTAVSDAGLYYYNDDTSIIVSNAEANIYVLSGVTVDIVNNGDGNLGLNLYSVQKEEEKNSTTLTVTVRNAAIADSVLTLADDDQITVKGAYTSTEEAAAFEFSDMQQEFTVKENTKITGKLNFNVLMSTDGATGSQTASENPLLTAVGMTGMIIGTGSTIKVQSFSGTISVNDNNEIQIISITSGTVTGDATEAATYELGTQDDKASISSGAKLIFNGLRTNLTLKLNNNLNNAGTIQTIGLPGDESQSVIFNDGSIVMKKDADGSIPYMDKLAEIISSENGTVDITAFGDYADLSGVLKQNQEVGPEQIMTIPADLTIPAGITVCVYGQLIINSGVTVHIQAGGQLIVGTPANLAGQILYSLATVENYGTIEVGANTTQNVDAFTVAAGNVINHGLIVTPGSYYADRNAINVGDYGVIVNTSGITISEKDNVSLNMINSKDGVLYLYGNTEASYIANSGLVMIDGDALLGNLNICFAGKLGTVSASTITPGNSSLNVFSAKDVFGAICQDTKGSVSLSSDSTVYGFTAAGWSAKIADYGKTVTSRTTATYAVDIAGTPTVADDTKSLTLSLGGNVVVSTSLALNEDAILNLGTSKFRVYGEMSFETYTWQEEQVTNKNIVANGAAAYVYGLLTSKGAFTTASGEGLAMNAAYYNNASTYVYGPFVGIESLAEAAAVTTVYISGTMAMDSDVTIPAGMTINFKTAELYIGVENEPTLYVTNGARLTGDLMADAAKGIYVSGCLYAENYRNVMITDADTKIFAEVISFNKDTGAKMWTNVAFALSLAGPGDIIELSGNWTITKDITVPTLVTVNTAAYNVTVDDAVLTINGIVIANDIALEDSDNDGEPGEVVINGFLVSTDDFAKKDKYGEAVYFEEESATYAGETIGVTYYVLTGIQNLPDVALAGYDAEVYASKIGTMTLIGNGENVITFSGEIEDADLLVDNIILVIPKNTDVTMDIYNALGGFSFIGANSGSKGMIFTEDDDNGLVLSGTATEAPAAVSYAIKIVGITTVSAFTLDEDITIDGVLACEGTVKLTGNVTVKGSLIANNGAKVTIGDENTAALVLGSIIAMPASDDGSAGRVTIIPTKLIIGDANQAIGAEATVTGKVTAEQYWVYAGASIDPNIVSELKYMEFDIKNDEFLVIYGTGFVDVVSIEPYMPSAEFLYWYDPETYEEAGDIEQINNQIWVAYVDYDIYIVAIKSDEGVKSIALDGMVMVSDETNVFRLGNLAAGEYKVTYTLKAGYEGIPVLTTSMGTILQGYTIQVIGEDHETPIVYQLTGTEKEVTPEPEPTPTPEEKSEWTITTILLVILVILIAIMAVIVALRLNRS